jgi:TonB family protein
MIHDSFFKQWDQPTSVMEAGRTFATTLRITIEKDGRISSSTVVNSSGNVVMDESVLAAAKRVKRIAQLPAGIAKGESYTINIAFELDQN